MHTKAELRELLRHHHLRLTKRLGQHYLVDPRMTARLVSACHLSDTDTIIEIGAGLGALTDLLAATAKRVVAIEVDRAICALLASRLANFTNVQVICQDILTFDWSRYPSSKVVGAIPYHITSPILVNLCEPRTTVYPALSKKGRDEQPWHRGRTLRADDPRSSPPRWTDVLRGPPSRAGDVGRMSNVPGLPVVRGEQSPPVTQAWLGLQREVAARLTARPGTKAYGRLTILVQHRFETRQLMRIPRSAFFPPPQVDSAWVHLSARAVPLARLDNERLFFDVVRAAFSQRRKTLLNCLGLLGAPRLDRPTASAMIEALGFPPGVRGEALSVEEFAQLANAVHQHLKAPH